MTAFPDYSDVSPNQYRLIQVYELEGLDTLDEKLDDMIGFPSILPLNDGSLEVLVHLNAFPSLERHCPHAITINSDYNPLRSNSEATEDGEDCQTKEELVGALVTRAFTQIAEGLEISARFYARTIALRVLYAQCLASTAQDVVQDKHDVLDIQPLKEHCVLIVPTLTLDRIQESFRARGIETIMMERLLASTPDRAGILSSLSEIITRHRKTQFFASHIYEELFHDVTRLHIKPEVGTG